MSEAISWDVVQRVAARVADAKGPSEDYHSAALQSHFDELTAQAEELVGAATGLRSLAGPARARVTDRAGWVTANVASFQRLLRPVIDRLAPRLPGGPLASVGRVAAGVQVGTILGWMSTRVLGQYDLLLVEEERPEDQDMVYFVGPNIVGLEKRFGFPPKQFRLWLALHEVTHRAQFTGVPWMRAHFLALVEKGIGSIDPDPRRLLEAFKTAAGQIREGTNPLADGGLLNLVAGPEQRAAIGELQSLMSLLEGHGDVVMDRAGTAAIPSAGRFSRVLKERRNQARGPARLLQQLIGLEAKMRQYQEGEDFIAAVEADGGMELFDTVWRGPEWLPSLEEVRDPPRWVSRVRAAAAAQG